MLLAYALAMMGAQRQQGDGLVVQVIGKQWWWRVVHLPPGRQAAGNRGERGAAAGGLRGEIGLAAIGVIHSFWVPALGGWMDLIPGCETRISLLPTETGVFRSQCVEFCGASHALMAFGTVVMAPDDFDAWLALEAADGVPPAGAGARRLLGFRKPAGIGAARGRVGAA